ncbi:hypothetical protein C7212DRAFT_347490 [Tuber magnatum]|uniref:Uncharacterized protein n=1 Tax=Tuber magnatum TaxID=42249 RepID=A0A317SEW4_9PEZI|nr:hypothetical protein C7212DRAFT_347490 [Tuber magnatum]
METSQTASVDSQQGSEQAPVRPPLQGQPPAPSRPVRTTYILARPPRNSNLFASNPFSRRLRLQIQQYPYPVPSGNPSSPIAIAAPNSPASPCPGTPATPASSSSNTTATTSTMAPTTGSTAATSTISPNIPTTNTTTSTTTRALRPTPIYNLASPPLRRSRRGLKVTVPDSKCAVAVFRPDSTAGHTLGSSRGPGYLLEFALALQLGLGQCWRSVWRASKWIWARTGWPGEAVWRKTGDLQGGQAVWVLEVFAVATRGDGGGGCGGGRKAVAANAVGVQVAGRVGANVWVEKGAGVGVLDGLYFCSSSGIPFAHAVG